MRASKDSGSQTLLFMITWERLKIPVSGMHPRLIVSKLLLVEPKFSVLFKFLR